MANFRLPLATTELGTSSKPKLVDLTETTRHPDGSFTVHTHYLPGDVEKWSCGCVTRKLDGSLLVYCAQAGCRRGKP